MSVNFSPGTRVYARLTEVSQSRGYTVLQLPDDMTQHKNYLEIRDMNPCL